MQERPPTLEFHMVDEAQQSGKVPPGDKLYQQRDGTAILLKGDAVASGDEVAEAIAVTTADGPTVYIRLDAAAQPPCWRPRARISATAWRWCTTAG